jgi:putative ABC transport system permease protein
MKILLTLGWRNLWRHKRRSIIVISSIVIGIIAMMFSKALMNGMNDQTVENTISTSLGHVAIHKKGFQDNMKIDLNFAPGALKGIHGDKKSVVAFLPRVKVQGMIRSSEASRGVIIVGIDPAKEKASSKIYDYTTRDGISDFLTSPDDNSILISKSLASRLGIVVGDRLVLMIQDSKNEIVGVGMKLKGVFQTPMDSFDRYFVFAGIKKLQEITGLGGNINEITILLKDMRDADSVKKDIKSKVARPDIEVLSWKDMAPSLVSAIKIFDTMIYIFYAVIFVTVIFSVANTMIMAIMERFHEIGVMKSIGTRPSWIFLMIMTEAFNLGMVGLIVGIAASIGLTMALGVNGIDFSIFSESLRMWGSGSIIYPTIKTLDIIIISLIVLGTNLIAAVYPALKAMRIKPLEALNFI